MAATWPTGTADCAAHASAAPAASVSADGAEVGSSIPAYARWLQRACSPDANPAGSADCPAQRPPPTALRRDWRAHLRADCLARVRSDRGALLRQLRAAGGGGGGGGGGEDCMHALLSGVIAEVAGAGAARAGRPSLEQATEDAAGGVGAMVMELQLPPTPALAAGAAAGVRSSRDMAAELWDWSVAPADVRRAGCQRAASPSGARPACI